MYCNKEPVSSRVMQCCWHVTVQTDNNAQSKCASNAYAVRCVHCSALKIAMCIDMCIDMRIDMCTDMCMDICIDMCVYGH